MVRIVVIRWLPSDQLTAFAGPLLFVTYTIDSRWLPFTYVVFKCLNATRQEQEAACPVDPYEILADQSSYWDQQQLKLQEEPEFIPAGEMPRTMMVTVDRQVALD